VADCYAVTVRCRPTVSNA